MKANAKTTIKTSAMIFDMDGVITDTMPYHFQAWKAVFASQGIIVSHEDIYKREGQKGLDSVKEIFQEKGHAYLPVLGAELLAAKEEMFKNIFESKFIDGSLEFISKIKKQGFRLGLVTGTSRHEAQKLLPTNLWDCFDCKVCGCEVQNGKPHPEPYLKALNQMSINPSQAVVFENAPFGIQAAKAAGLYCLALETSLPRSFLASADEIFFSFQEIENKLCFIYTQSHAHSSAL